EAAHRALLDRLQQLGLDRVGKKPDLIEEEDPAVGGLEQTGLRLARVRERTSLEAEHLGLEQGLRQGSAVDLDERAMAARAAAMDGAGQHALASSSLADEENGRQPHRIRGAIEQPRDLGANSAKRPALTDQFREKHDPYGNAGSVSRSMGAHRF